MYYVKSNELYHHGVKGMKWGVRKQRPTFERDGSKKTVKKLNKVLDADAKYGEHRTARQNKRIRKLQKQYEKSAGRDIKKAVKNDNENAAKSIAAGRTYLKMIMDSNYFNTAVTGTAKRANVEVGKDFAYDFLRDDSRGGVTVTINGHSETYAYLPEVKNK